MSKFKDVSRETQEKLTQGGSNGEVYRGGDSGLKISLSGNIITIKPDYDFNSTSSSNLCERGEITRFTESSRRRMVKFLRTCRAKYINMVTLTYPGDYPLDGSVSKEHLRRFIQELKRYTERNDKAGCNRWSVFWFMEFQERGAIHYHLFTTHDYDKDYISSVWYSIVGSEDERHLRAGTRIERLKAGKAGVVSYASKYAQKEEQKQVPDNLQNCGRFWGVSGDRYSVSATIRITPEGMQDKSIKRGLDTLKKAIKEALKSKILKIYVNGEWGSVYIVNNIAGGSDVRRAIYALEARIANCMDSTVGLYYEQVGHLDDELIRGVRHGDSMCE